MTSHLSKTLGRNVRERRAELKLSQAALAKKLGKSQQYVSGVESGASNVTLFTLEALAKALDTKVTKLLAIRRIVV